MNLLRPLIAGIVLACCPPSHAGLVYFYSSLDGGQTVPESGSPAWGSATATLDTETLEFGLGGLVGSLSSPITSASINIGGPGANGPIVVPVTAVVGGISGPINTGLVNLSPGQEIDLLNSNWYVTVQTVDFPEGEIRGRIFFGDLVPVPEPAEWGYLGAACLVGYFIQRRVRARLTAFQGDAH